MITQTQTPVRIDIVSDVVCPWCIIGYKQLEVALKEAGVTAEITWHPFELNPYMPLEGQNMAEHVAEKYGISPQESERNRDLIVQAGINVGFEFNFSDDSRMHNTFMAHQLLHWAQTQGRQHDLKLALFSAHFIHGRNLNSIEVLATEAESVGLDRAEAVAVLADARFGEDVSGEEQTWQQKGIRSVPATVFNERKLVSGAQGKDAFTEVLQEIADEAVQS